MNDLAIKDTEISRVAAATAAFLDAPLDEIEVEVVAPMSDGVSYICVYTSGRLGHDLEDDIKLAAGLSKLLDCPVFIAADQEETLDEYVDGVFSRRLEIDESGETAVFVDKP